MHTTYIRARGGGCAVRQEERCGESSPSPSYYIECHLSKFSGFINVDWNLDGQWKVLFLGRMFPRFVRERSNVGRREMEWERWSEQQQNLPCACSKLFKLCQGYPPSLAFSLDPQTCGSPERHLCPQGECSGWRGIVLNSNLSKTLKDSANPGMLLLLFLFPFLPIRVSGFWACSGALINF